MATDVPRIVLIVVCLVVVVNAFVGFLPTVAGVVLVVAVAAWFLVTRPKRTGRS